MGVWLIYLARTNRALAPGTSTLKCHGLNGGDSSTVDIPVGRPSCQCKSGPYSDGLSVKILSGLARRIDG